MTGDLQHASVFYTVFGDGRRPRGSRRPLSRRPRAGCAPPSARQLGIRLTPELEFIADAIPERAAHLEDLLREAGERDAERGRGCRQGAVYAGDADPYKQSADDEPTTTRMTGRTTDGARA